MGGEGARRNRAPPPRPQGKSMHLQILRGPARGPRPTPRHRRCPLALLEAGRLLFPSSRNSSAHLSLPPASCADSGFPLPRLGPELGPSPPLPRPVVFLWTRQCLLTPAILPGHTLPGGNGSPSVTLWVSCSSLVPSAMAGRQVV